MPDASACYATSEEHCDARNSPKTVAPVSHQSTATASIRQRRRVRNRNGTGEKPTKTKIQQGLKTRPHNQEVSQAVAVRRPDHEAWRMATTSNSLNGLLDESLAEPPIGETDHFHWHATPVGIAALWQGDHAPPTPPFNEALTEGLKVGLDLSREEREFHQVTKGLVLLFHS